MRFGFLFLNHLVVLYCKVQFKDKQHSDPQTHLVAESKLTYVQELYASVKHEQD